MYYEKLTKSELIEIIKEKDDLINSLKRNNQSRNPIETLSKTLPSLPAYNNPNAGVSFEIINFREVDSWTRIELYWKNNTSRNIQFIEGTLKFYDKNNQLVGIDNNHICGILKPYSEKAEIVQYLTSQGEIPLSAVKVNISISNIY